MHVQEEADAAVVQSVWHRLLPGLLEDFDAPKSLHCIAPRPLFVVNGRDDPRCVFRVACCWRWLGYIVSTTTWSARNRWKHADDSMRHYADVPLRAWMKPSRTARRHIAHWESRNTSPFTLHRLVMRLPRIWTYAHAACWVLASLHVKATCF